MPLSTLRFGSDSERNGIGDPSRLNTGSRLRSDPSRLGAGAESLLSQSRLAQSEARAKAQKTRAGSVGKIDGEPNSNGTYEVLDIDGSTHSGVQSRKRAKWLDGQWVLLEWVQGQPQIAGFAPHGAG